jgi:hypothetical protein
MLAIQAWPFELLTAASMGLFALVLLRQARKRS